MYQPTTQLHQTTSSKRVIQAFIFSPFLSVGIASMILGLETFGTLIVIAYTLACIFGIPAYFILRELHCLNIWGCLLAGYLMSVSGLCLILCFFSQMNSTDDLLTLFFLPYHLITLFATLVFWCIAVKQTEIDITDQPPARNKSQIDPG